MGGAPKAPAEAGGPTARQERAAGSCRRDLGSTGRGRVVLLPGLVDCREHVDTATARPGAPREPLGTRCQRRRTQALWTGGHVREGPGPVLTTSAPSEAGLRSGQGL